MRERMIGEPSLQDIGKEGIIIELPPIYSEKFTNEFNKIASKRVLEYMFEPDTVETQERVEDAILSSFISAMMECARSDILLEPPNRNAHAKVPDGISKGRGRRKNKQIRSEMRKLIERLNFPTP